LVNPTNIGCKISGISHFLPDTVMTNDDIITQHSLRLKSEWVRLHIGITERRWCNDDENASSLAANVLNNLVELNAVTQSNIGALIVSTVSSDVRTPSTASIVQSLSAPGENFPCFDITAACSGFIYALDIGRRFVQTGLDNVVCIASEIRSRNLNKQDRRTVMLFGDGAAGVSLAKCEGDEVGIIYTKTMGDGRYWDAISVPHNGFITMKEAGLIFESAIKEMSNLVTEGLQTANLSSDDIDHFIFHQASGIIVDKVAESLNLPEHKCPKNFSTRGNMTSASVPVALSEATVNGNIKKGDMVCLVATGGGFSAGITILRWEL